MGAAAKTNEAAAQCLDHTWEPGEERSCVCKGGIAWMRERNRRIEAAVFRSRFIPPSEISLT